MELSFFNVNHGFGEALVRGLRSGFLSARDYSRINTAESLEDVRSALEDTDYGTFLQDEESKNLKGSTIAKRCYEKLANEFQYVKAQTSEPLTTFMDYIAREKMIDNVCMIISGAINNQPPKELEDKIHPLGVFDGMKVIMSENFDMKDSFDNIYKIFLLDTPIGPYFEQYMRKVKDDEGGQGGDGTRAEEQFKALTDADMDIMANTLHKAWLEDFYEFVCNLGGTTEECMGHMLKMEADFRVLLLTINTLRRDSKADGMSLDKRNSTYPEIGYLYPFGLNILLDKGNDEDSVKEVLANYKEYLELYEKVQDFYNPNIQSNTPGSLQTIEDVIYAKSVQMYEMAFEQQYHFGVFYAWVKLREQEIRNIKWIADMVVIHNKEQVEQIVPIFDPKTRGLA